MKYFLFLIFLFKTIILLSVPILTDVVVLADSSITVKFNIINPKEEKFELQLACFKDTVEFKVQEGIMQNLKSGNHSIKIDRKSMPADFNLKEYRLFPKLLYKGRIYYEMKRIKSGSYKYSQEKNIIELVTVNEFYISKFEITNEQFEAFVNADGYEFEEYWEIPSDLMSKNDIGWYYLSKYKMTLPLGWNFKQKPYYKQAASNFRYSPVTNIRWFEAYAFANWMESELPTFEQMQVAFSLSKVSGKPMYSGISEFDKGRYPLQKVRDGVSEWLESGVEPNSLACAGCNEMYFIENNSDYILDKLTYSIKCPLFRAPFLGARIVINTDRAKIK